MNYTEIMEKEEQNLKGKGLSMYLQAQGTETGYVALRNVEFFKALCLTMPLTP